MDRIYFLDKKDRIRFFNTIKENNNFGWEKIAKKINTNRSMIDLYKRGKLCIPKDRFELLMEFIPENNRHLYLERISKKESNWGQKIGGRKAYRINKKKFEEGRKKGAQLKKNFPKYIFDINLNLSEELCEFIGAIIGDGFTNKYASFYQTQITGDNLLDLEYYENKLKPICESLFNISPKITRKGNSIRLNIYSKNLFDMLTKRFRIPAGKKCYTITIPNEILKADAGFIKSTLRGMFDTDGGIGLDKRSIYKRPYIRINYTSSSLKLIEQVHNLLNEYKIPHSVHKKGDSQNRQIQINGEKNVSSFLRKIGFSNNRHLKKVQYLLK